MATLTGKKSCVFVGNIPYDATEEQLMEICQEVGPVVSFRLVLDKETGKPKGYGFCEYKDEETALSARRNLQGYEINGRQLRVDFAENDKGSDRNREQGRGGPGMAATNASLPKQMGGPAARGDSIHNQAIGLQVAMKAAADMAKALGGPQASMYQNGLLQSTPANDQLTFHLAKLSRNQLTEILAELKGMATYNKESARQLLLARPHLSKALFQAEIMLDLVTPQVLQMSNLRQAPIQPAQPVPGDALLNQQQAVPSFFGLPPLVQRTQPELLPKVQQIPNVPQSSSQATMQPQVQLLQQPPFQLGTLPGPSGSFTSISARPVVPPVTASSTQHPRPLGVADLGYNPSMGLSTANSAAPSVIPHRPSTIDAGFQPGSASSSMPLRTANDAAFRPGHVLHDPNVRINGQSNRPSKLMKLEDGRGTAFPKGGSDRAPQVDPSTFTPAPIPEGQHLEKQTPQSELPPDVESVLLQQVMNLTPEQISSLPPEQQQQVIQLQEMIRRDKRPPP